MLEERFVKADRTVFFAHLGVYGAVLSGLQTAALEREPLALAWRSLKQADVSGQLELIALALGFSLSLALFYVMVGRLLEVRPCNIQLDKSPVGHDPSPAHSLSLVPALAWTILTVVFFQTGGLERCHHESVATYSRLLVRACGSCITALAAERLVCPRIRCCCLWPWDLLL